jgi:hypothetical protein
MREPRQDDRRVENQEARLPGLSPGFRVQSAPKGHAGIIQLNGRRLSKGDRFEKTRYRCLPPDATEKAHDFIAPMTIQPKPRRRVRELRAIVDRGLASGWRYAFAVSEIATALLSDQKKRRPF